MSAFTNLFELVLLYVNITLPHLQIHLIANVFEMLALNSTRAILLLYAPKDKIFLSELLRKYDIDVKINN